MIVNKKGNILDAEENLICHQVNCRGVMGAGLAKQVTHKYPKVFTSYRHLINSVYGSSSMFLGDVQYVNVGEDKYVCNLFGQNYYGNNPLVQYTDYGALRNCLIKVRGVAIKHNYSMALPYMIGCGKGNGKWDEVLEIIESIFKDDVVKVSIYRL